METSVLQDQQYMFGIRSLLIIKKVLMNDDDEKRPAHAASNQPPALFFSYDIHKLFDSLND